MLLHEKAEKARQHVRSKLRKKKHAHDQKSTALEAEERTMRTVMELEEQLRAEHEALVLLDRQRRDQIGALVGQLEILGVEPAVHLDDSAPVHPNPPPSLASTRRSLDIPRARPPRRPALQTSALVQGASAHDDHDDHDHDHDPSAADVPRVVVVRAARRPSAASTGGEEDAEGSGASGSEGEGEDDGEYTEGEDEDEEYDEGEDDEGDGSGSGSGSASEENEPGSPRGSTGTSTGASEGSPGRRQRQRAARARSPRSPRMAAAEARGNEALQMRLHEMECAMEEQDSRHEQELEQLTAQLDDAKALVSQYQSLLGESEVALQRAETAVGLQSAIAAKPQHTALSENELRAVARSAQLQGALTDLLAAVEAANVQNSGPTLHRLHALLRGIADGALQHTTAATPATDSPN